MIDEPREVEGRRQDRLRALAEGPIGKRVTSIWNWGFPINAALTDKQKKATWLFIQWAAIGRDAGAHLVEVRRPGQALRRQPHFAVEVAGVRRSDERRRATTSSRPRSSRSSTTPTSTGARACRSGRRSARPWRPRSSRRSSARRSRRKRSTRRRRASSRSCGAERRLDSDRGGDLDRRSARMERALRARAASRRRSLVLLADHDRAARLPGLEQPASGSTSAMPWLRRLRRRSTTTRRWAATRASGIRCWLTVVYTGSTVVLQVVARPLARAAGAADPERPGLAARRRDPADRARAGRRRPVLAHAGARAGRSAWSTSSRARSGLGSHNWLGDPAARADLGDRDPHLAMDAVRVPRAARDARDAAARRLRSRAARPRRRVAALLAHHAAADPPGHRDGRDPAHDDRRCRPSRRSSRPPAAGRAPRPRS